MICPICNLKMEIQIIDTRDGKQKIHRCKYCDLIKLDNKMPKNYYKYKYRRKHVSILNKKYNPRDMFNLYVNYQNHRVDNILPYLNNDKKLLEIGCSVGHFLYNIKDKISISGVEKDEKSRKYCEKRCGCKVYSDISKVNEKFDIICIFQTLEHVDEPIEFLSLIRDILKDDGIIYIEIPNLNDALRIVYDIKSFDKFYFHEAHIFYYSDTALSKLMKKVRIKGTIGYFQDYSLYNHIYWNLMNKPQNSYMDGILPNLFKYRDNECINKEIFESFFNKLNKEYKYLLEKMHLSNNLFFIGKKENG